MSTGSVGVFTLFEFRAAGYTSLGSKTSPELTSLRYCFSNVAIKDFISGATFAVLTVKTVKDSTNNIAKESMTFAMAASVIN